MPRHSFVLESKADQFQFEKALQLLQEARAAGWTLVGADMGFSGGLPAGQLVISSGTQRETIPFRIAGPTLAGFRDAAGKVAELPAGLWMLTDAGVERGGGQAEGYLTVEPIAGSRGAPMRPLRAAPSRRSATLIPKLCAAQAAEPSAYDLTEAAALQALREGEGQQADQLRVLLGDDYFKLLASMAQQAAGKRTRGRRQKVFVLPGIMGSKLGKVKSLLGLQYNDVIWLDPVDMRLGRLGNLTLRADGKAQHDTQSVGVLYSFYLRIKLTLDLAGFDADFHHYDWRRPIRDLGNEFARFLQEQPEPAIIVAHSMGGVVTRAAMKAGADKQVKRLIMLGTPNHGSYVPAQALRAAYPFLKKLALSFDRDLATVTEDVFASFAGLYDLLPAEQVFPNFPIFDPGKWPKTAPHARADLIRAARGAQALLHQPAAGDPRFHLIAGVGEDTVMDVRVEDGEFIFLQSRDGDGTVPRISAELPNCQSFYVKGSHGMLPNYKVVCDLATALAAETSTADIPTEDWKPPTEPLREVRESALRSASVDLRDFRRGQEPSPAVLREILSPILGLPPLEADQPAGATEAGSGKPPGADGGGGALFQKELKGVVVGRRRQRQLEVALCHGSLTQVSSRAYLLGLFQGVAPAGAALAVDEMMNGVIGDFVQRRMLSGRLGEIFIVPKGRTYVPVDHVIFVGLGPFDRFKEMQSTVEGQPDAMRLICESAIRTCLHANIEEFATVLLGGSAADNTAAAVRLFAQSFLSALQTADPARRLRKVTLCETDPQRVAEMRTALIQLATTDLFDEVELELRDVTTPASAPVSRPSVVSSRRPSPLYLLTRMFEQPEDKSAGSGGRPPAAGRLMLETSLLTPQSRAAVLTSRPRYVSVAERDRLLAPLSAGDLSPARLEQLGRELVQFVFGEDMQQALARLADSVRDLPLVIVHDPVASQLPWEAFRFGDWTPALAGGVVRQHLDSNLSVAKWLDQRAEDDLLDVLLVTDPTSNLAGAEGEGDNIRALLNKVPDVRVTERRRSQATKAQLLADFRSGQFDVVHYAGHAFFAPLHPGRSGLICAGDEVLSGADLAGLSNLPSLIFFNACESGRIRGGRAGRPVRADVKNVSVATAFIRGGVMNFLGTYWPVGDAPAKKFSETLYPLLVQGRGIGEAVLSARRAVQQSGSVDWADYLFYGNPEFTLKRAAK